MCPIKLRTKPPFVIFHFLKINRIIPFCNWFIERPSYIQYIVPSVLVHGLLLRTAQLAVSSPSTLVVSHDHCQCSLRLPADGWPGWVGMDGWIRRWTITHSSTNQNRLVLLGRQAMVLRSNVLPVCFFSTPEFWSLRSPSDDRGQTNRFGLRPKFGRTRKTATLILTGVKRSIMDIINIEHKTQDTTARSVQSDETVAAHHLHVTFRGMAQ